MKVGILTMHRVLNYGSFMQGYALKRTIESLGHEVEFRDFKPGVARHLGNKVVKPGAFNKVAKIPGKLANLGNTLKKRKFRQQMDECFRLNCWPSLGVTAQLNHSLQADAMIIGSDEVFNYTQNHAFGYVPCLFGHGIDAPIIASYAASAGYANWQDVVADDMMEELASGLRKMQHTAVRDENTRLLVQQCTGRSPTLVVDPTLIYDFSADIAKNAVLKPGYLLVYAYEGRMETEEEVEEIRAFARRENLRIVSPGFYHDWCDENIVVTPFELLRVFADASYVVTDTFHGSIFAMLMGRKLATLIRDKSQWGSNSNKVRYLLEQFGMASRILGDIRDMSRVFNEPAPYEEFRSRQVAWKKTSLDYLHKVLKESV